MSLMAKTSMFSVFDRAGKTVRSPRTTTSRACDQCKARKVRCDMSKLCSECTKQGFNCTYDSARRRRGHAGKRIQEIQRQQQQSGADRVNSQVDHVADHGSWQVGHSVPSTALRSEHSDSELHLATRVTSNGASQTEFDTTSSHSVHWQLNVPARDVSPVTIMPDHVARDVQGLNPVNSLPEAVSATDSRSSPTLSELMFPSLPIDSPSHDFDAFMLIPQQGLPPLPENACLWPDNIDEHALFPWIDVYFKRLNSIGPILNRTSTYHSMLMRKHRTDSHYGAMLLVICAFAMSQPVQIHEHASALSRSVQAHILMQECVKMRSSADFGEDTTIEMVLTSLFLFSCLFNNSKQKAAALRLREAMSLAQSLGLHLPDSYTGLDAETREQWLRTYLSLSITERAYALQRHCAIGFTGRPGITARFMQAFDPNMATEYISHFTSRDHADSIAMTGLLYLMETFDNIGESLIECWNSNCVLSDGVCEYFDRRRALQAFRAQFRAQDACLTGNISFAPTASPLPLPKLSESQQVDILITQCWLLNRLWSLCLSHGLLQDSSDHIELCYIFACHVAMSVHATCNSFPLSALEVHGVGLVEKVYDIAEGVITAIQVSTYINLDTVLTELDQDKVYIIDGFSFDITVRALLQTLNRAIQEFRGGDHQYSHRLRDSLTKMPGYQGEFESELKVTHSTAACHVAGMLS